jgi:hypothetical protein
LQHAPDGLNTTAACHVSSRLNQSDAAGLAPAIARRWGLQGLLAVTWQVTSGRRVWTPHHRLHDSDELHMMPPSSCRETAGWQSHKSRGACAAAAAADPKCGVQAARVHAPDGTRCLCVHVLQLEPIIQGWRSHSVQLICRIGARLVPQGRRQMCIWYALPGFLWLRSCNHIIFFVVACSRIPVQGFLDLLQVSPSAHSPLPLWVGGADTECENVKVSATESLGTAPVRHLICYVAKLVRSSLQVCCRVRPQMAPASGEIGCSNLSTVSALLLISCRFLCSHDATRAT